MNKVFTFLFALISSFTFGQNSTKVEYFSQDNVTINITLEDCVNHKKGTAKQYFFIEIINDNSLPVNVSFDKEIWYNNVCQTCDSQSNEYKVISKIEANNSISGGCMSNNKSLRIFSKMLNLDKVRKLSKYELKNINVEVLK